jgi:uncharacterized membrane protein
MSQGMSLNEAERKVFRSGFQDGLVEIMLGCVVLMFAVGPYLSPYLGDFWSSAIFLPFWAAAFGLLWLVKRQVVTPRIGVVEFGAWRKTRLLRFNVLMFVACTVVLILGILSALSFGAVPGWTHVAQFSLMILIAFCVTAYFLDFSGLYLYGVLIALAPLVGEGLYVYFGVPHHGYPVTFGLTTAILVLAGLGKLIRLLRTYPLPDDGAPQEAPIHG